MNNSRILPSCLAASSWFDVCFAVAVLRAKSQWIRWPNRSLQQQKIHCHQQELTHLLLKYNHWPMYLWLSTPSNQVCRQLIIQSLCRVYLAVKFEMRVSV